MLDRRGQTLETTTMVPPALRGSVIGCVPEPLLRGLWQVRCDAAPSPTAGMTQPGI